MHRAPHTLRRALDGLAAVLAHEEHARVARDAEERVELGVGFRVAARRRRRAVAVVEQARERQRDLRGADRARRTSTANARSVGA